MVSLPDDRCAQCGGPCRRESDGFLICSECDYETPMGGDEMRAPVLLERPGMFRSYKTLALVALLFFGSGLLIAYAAWRLLR